MAWWEDPVQFIAVVLILIGLYYAIREFVRGVRF
jgi:hypothetical protein